MSGDTSVAQRYLGSTVTGFQNGSIVVDYVVRLNDTRTGPSDPAVLDFAFKDSYGKGVQSGELNITVDITASRVAGMWKITSTAVSKEHGRSS